MLPTYGGQSTDVSEGRYSDGASQRYAMPRPSPRNQNGVPSNNTPPRFPLLTNVLIAPGQGITTTVRATDPDLQTITYSTNSAVVQPGMVLSQIGGTLRWNCPTNQPLGDYSVALTVTDNGVPPLGDSTVLTYTVRIVTPFTPATNSPLVHATVNVGGQMSFTIDTIPGRTYRILYKDDLNAPTWTQLGPDFVAANAYASLSDNAVVPHRFYQVVQLN